MQLALKRELPLVCANPDLFALRGDLKYIRGGTVAEWYVARGGPVKYRQTVSGNLLVRLRFGTFKRGAIGYGWQYAQHRYFGRC